jgi:hypothetical protein
MEKYRFVNIFVATATHQTARWLFFKGYMKYTG